MFLVLPPTFDASSMQVMNIMPGAVRLTGDLLSIVFNEAINHHGMYLLNSTLS